MQRNVYDLIGWLVARARRLVAAWGSSEGLGMCLLAIGLLLLPAFVSADDGGRFTYRTVTAIAVANPGECAADVRHPPESRRGVQAPPGRAELGMRKLASIFCNGRARVVRTMPMLVPPVLAPVLARFVVDPEAPSTFVALLAMLAGLVATATYAFAAAAELFCLVRQERAGGVPPRKKT